MANTLTGLFQTLVVPAAAAGAQAPKFRNVMSEYIYTQYRGLHGEYGNTLNVQIPVVDEGNVTDIGSGPIQPTDRTHTSVSLTVNNNLSDSFVIRSFDQIRTPVDMKTLYMDASIENVLRKLNRTICNLVTTGNFSTYSSITGGADLFTRLNLASAWSNIVGGGAPMTPGDVFFVTSHIPYSNMIGDATQNFIQQYVVGEQAAIAAQQTARLMPQFQAAIDYDQQFPIPSAGAYAGLFFHRYAIAMVPVVQPAADNPLVKETFIYPKPNLPFRVQFWYDPQQQGYVVHTNCVFALKVVRPEFGSFLVTT